MAISLIQGEKIIKSYDYGKKKSYSVDAASEGKNLTITNRRIIHSCTVKGAGRDGLSVSEIPIDAAKYVNTFCLRKRYPLLLVFAILFALLAIAFLPMGNFAVAIMILLVAVVFAIAFLVKKDCIFTCSIGTNGITSALMSFGSASGNSLTRRFFKSIGNLSAATTVMIKMKVNADVAKQMTEELGTVILAAANGEYNA